MHLTTANKEHRIRIRWQKDIDNLMLWWGEEKKLSTEPFFIFYNIIKENISPPSISTFLHSKQKQKGGDEIVRHCCTNDPKSCHNIIVLFFDLEGKTILFKWYYFLVLINVVLRWKCITPMSHKLHLKIRKLFFSKSGWKILWKKMRMSVYHYDL